MTTDLSDRDRELLLDALEGLEAVSCISYHLCLGPWVPSLGYEPCKRCRAIYRLRRRLHLSVKDPRNREEGMPLTARAEIRWKEEQAMIRRGEEIDAQLARIEARLAQLPEDKQATRPCSTEGAMMPNCEAGEICDYCGSSECECGEEI